jgi:hypothetical protein
LVGPRRCQPFGSAVRVRQTSRSSMVIVTAMGPRIIPAGPNSARPPTNEINAGTVWRFRRFPTSIGYRRSMPPTTSQPHDTRITAFSQLPSSARKVAAGIQTTNAPKTGTTANKAMTRPQSSGVGRSSHQNINPPAANAIIIRAWRMVRSLTTAVTLFVGFKHRVAGPCSFANVEIRCNEGRNGAASGISHSISGEGGQLSECLLQGLPAQAAPSRSPPAEETRRSPREGARLQPELSRGATSALLGDRASARVDFSSATRWEH